ncbi:hypothetical protein BDZ91DRAFT_760299 [Kalaharituber pfeilii]|nr:hypothetical protein BDZ91DRAFT_760299 [Kalaharituber pfeilii]
MKNVTGHGPRPLRENYGGLKVGVRRIVGEASESLREGGNCNSTEGRAGSGNSAGWRWRVKGGEAMEGEDEGWYDVHGGEFGNQVLAFCRSRSSGMTLDAGLNLRRNDIAAKQGLKKWDGKEASSLDPKLLFARLAAHGGGTADPIQQQPGGSPWFESGLPEPLIRGAWSASEQYHGKTNARCCSMRACPLWQQSPGARQLSTTACVPGCWSVGAHEGWRCFTYQLPAASLLNGPIQPAQPAQPAQPFCSLYAMHKIFWVTSSKRPRLKG